MNAAIEALNSGAYIEDLELDSTSEVEKFNNTMKEFFFDEQIVSKSIDHVIRQHTWTYPKYYEDLDLEEFFIKKCDTIEQAERVMFELELYVKKNMDQLLRWCIWFMDVCKEKNLFIGVGRGSSVASYCLFLIEMHLVDSMKYGLDPIEFFKEL